MDELVAEFIAETREMLASLSGEVVAWEAAPADRERLDAIFRFVHTVKGNSGFFDLPRITALAHAAEDALSSVRDGRRAADAKLVGAVLAAVDRLGELVEALEEDRTADGDDSALIDALHGEQPAAPAEAPSASAVEHRPAPVRSIRLPIDLLDAMMSGVSDLVLARNELARRLRDSGAATEVGACFERVSATIAELRDAISRTRMQRIDNIFSVLPRLVRDLAAETGRKVQLVVDGGDVELDREMIETIRDPLTHIVRNAVGHGLEPPDARRAAGKPETGRLHVSARQSGNQIFIRVADDGRGIDGEALVAKALAAGLLTSERASTLTSAQRTALIFEPGLSTAAEVTSLSGRGVGMDVVRANVERIGGVVDIDSRPGEGTAIVLRVPLTLTIIPALTIGAGGQTFAIPRSAIEEIVRVKGGARIERLAAAAAATVRGRRMPLVCLATLTGREPAPEQEQTLVVLKVGDGGLYALAVAAVHDHEELVVRPAAPAVMAAGLYGGTTLADDGRPILLLDPAGIAERARVSPAAAEVDVGASDKTSAARQESWLLVRSFAGALRLVPVAAVERIEDVPAEAVAAAAGRLNVVLGDALLPLAGCDSPPVGSLRVLRLTDGRSEIGYGVAEVIDMLDFAPDVVPATAPGEVRGVCRVGAGQAELLDLHWLFARHAAPSVAAEAAPVCVLPDGDPFMDTILRPLVESAGYRVVAPGHPDAQGADVAILSSDGGEASAARVLRLRDTPEAEGEGDTLHRYDRAAIYGALAKARRA
jgi:two-component system chemotaxis sensor kinase CheA